ncbi:HWE histidine kinase domain-containing protein [Jiella avicenniae]|uniref:Blue-light-activated histidine kinase n=1 Tax=Jiella avicenniae TaxID=2907202 RepID=A0A9X1T6S1_9HYPH|nr:HWE histidine kinase domain-containing protein [Jiella avicenniae]MCE7030941.1 GAF domain-containing protein [Jiella avicenniae]
MSESFSAAPQVAIISPPDTALNDQDRLQALERSGLMDSAVEEVFDRAVRLASRILKAPVSLLSLVDTERQFFKAQTGLADPVAEARETPLSHSFCQHVVRQNEPLRVIDARTDQRVKDNLAIRDLNVIAYLGVPVRAHGGEILGSLCAIMPEPREWTDDDLANLSAVAQLVESEIALRESLANMEREKTFFRDVLDQLPIGIVIAEVPSAAIVMTNKKGLVLVNEEVSAEKAQDYRGLGAQHLTGARYRAAEYPLVRTVVEGETVVNEPMLYRRGDGSLIELEVSSQRVGNDQKTAVATFVDVTDRKQAETSAQEARTQLLQVLEATSDPVLFLKNDWTITYANKAFVKAFAGSRDLAGQTVWKAFPGWKGNPLWHAFHDATENDAIETAELFLEKTGQRYEARAFPSGDDLTVFFRDVTTERQVVETRQLLVRELNHRVKNLFAVVSGMISMTSRHTRTPAEMAKALRGRVHALARAHELIRPAVTQEDIGQPDVSLQNLVASLIEPHLTHENDQITIEGPALSLGANGSTSLAMVLHELATNAAKYGALSVPEGRLVVRWSTRADVVYMTWAESGGPQVEHEQSVSGFGSTLIDMSIRSQLRGTLDLHWRPEGLVVEFCLPLSRLQA